MELRDAALKYCLSSPFTLQRGWERESGTEREGKKGTLNTFQKTNQCISCRRCKGQGATNTDKELCSSRESRHSKAAQALQEMGALRAPGNGSSQGWTSNQHRAALPDQQGLDMANVPEGRRTFFPSRTYFSLPKCLKKWQERKVRHPQVLSFSHEHSPASGTGRGEKQVSSRHCIDQGWNKFSHLPPYPPSQLHSPTTGEMIQENTKQSNQCLKQLFPVLAAQHNAGAWLVHKFY